MNPVEQWLLREKRRQRARPRLEDALLSSRPVAYIAFRLRLVTLRVVLRTALHLIEIVALSQVLSPQALVPILLLRHLSLFAQTLWWGALEPQRIALREAHRKRDEGAYASICSRWALFAAMVVLIEIGLTGLWFLSPAHTTAGHVIYDAYAVACGWRLCLDTWSRTQHSSVYAVSRVQRPLWSMLLVDFMEVFGLLWAWLRVGPYAFALVLAVGGAFRCAFSLYFTERTRGKLGLPRRARSILRELTRGGMPSLPFMQVLKFAGLNASLQVESVVILLLTVGLGGAAGVVLSMTIHAFSPLLGAGYSWARVFYFDLKRIEGIGEPFFARRLGRLLDRVALLYPVLLVVLVVPIANLLAPEFVPDGPAPIALFVIARSLFSIRQIEAFAYVDYRVQLRQSLILSGLLVVVSLCAPEPPWFFYAIVGAFLVAALAGRRARLSQASGESAQVLGFEAWLEWLRCSSKQWRIASMIVDRSTTTLLRVRRALLDSGHPCPMSRVSRARWVTLVSADANEYALRARLLEASGGTLSTLKFGGVIDHSNMLARLQEMELVPPELSDAAAALVSDPIAPIEREFAQRFPHGACLTERSGSLARLGQTGGAMVSQIVRDILAPSQAERAGKSVYSVATYRPNGKLTHVFIAPTSATTQAAFLEFEVRLRNATLQRSMADPSPRGR